MVCRDEKRGSALDVNAFDFTADGVTPRALTQREAARSVYLANACWWRRMPLHAFRYDVARRWETLDGVDRITTAMGASADVFWTGPS